jgi:hypothetical protein
MKPQTHQPLYPKTSFKSVPQTHTHNQLKWTMYGSNATHRIRTIHTLAHPLFTDKLEHTLTPHKTHDVDMGWHKVHSSLGGWGSMGKHISCMRNTRCRTRCCQTHPTERITHSMNSCCLDEHYYYCNEIIRLVRLLDCNWRQRCHQGWVCVFDCFSVLGASHVFMHVCFAVFGVICTCSALMLNLCVWFWGRLANRRQPSSMVVRGGVSH